MHNFTVLMSAFVYMGAPGVGSRYPNAEVIPGLHDYVDSVAFMNGVGRKGHGHLCSLSKSFWGSL